jgi:hypothetical protein
MRTRTLLSLAFVMLLAGCGKVSSDFRKAGDAARDEIVNFRDAKFGSQSDIEQHRDAIKPKLEVVTAATKSEREHSAESVLVNFYVQVSVLKEAQMLPPSPASEQEVSRLTAHAEQCLKEYDALVGKTRDSANENGPCLKEAKAAAER